MNVLITLTSAGADTGPFNLYSNVDTYTTAFETNISKGILVAGYTSTIVPPGTTSIRVKSTGVCSNYVDLVLSVPSTTTTTTTAASTTTSTSTTTAPSTSTTTTAAPVETTTTTTTYIGPATTTTTTTSAGTSTTTTSTSTTSTTTTSLIQTTYSMALVNNDLDCTTDAPTEVWSYLVFPFGYYFINGNSTDKYFIQPATHTTYDTQITSKTDATCVPVPRYTYLVQSLQNSTTCELSVGSDMWSYDVIADGWYFINGDSVQKYYIQSAVHTTYTSQISNNTATTACVPVSCMLYRVVNNDSTDATVTWRDCSSNALLTDTVFANSNINLTCAKTGSVTCTASDYTIDPLDNCT